MHAETFLREFAPLASGSGGVKKLRELVLQLAVRGKLVPQDASDEPAISHLSRVISARSTVDPKFKARGRSESLAVERSKFPSAWELVELGDLARPQSGFAFKSGGFNTSGHGYPLIRIRDVGQQFSGTYFEGDFRDEFLVQSDDYLISMDGEFRVAKWQGAPALLNQRVTRLIFFEEELKRDFVAIALQFELAKLQGKKAYTTVDHLSGKQIAAAPIPLPPVTEQKRIVAKVDELMALCDELGARQAEETDLKRAAASSALHHLTEARSPQETAARWSLLAPRFGELFDDLETIKALRAALVRSLCSGAFSEKPIVSSDYDGEAYPIPRSWEWVKLGSLLDNVTSGSRGWSQYFAPDGERFIRSQDIKFDRIEFDEPVFVKLPGTVEGTRTSVQPGDLLLTITGANTGKCAIVDDLDCTSYVSQHVALLRPKNIENTRYLHIWLTGDWAGRAILLKDSYGIRSGLNLKQIRDLPVPLPPLAEQKRIVAKVDELMALCDRLKEQVREGDRLNVELMASLVHALTETDPDSGGAAEPDGFAEHAPAFAASEPANGNTPRAPETKSARAVPNARQKDKGAPARAPGVDTKFQEAVLVGAIVEAFFEAGGEPIGNFRLQKAVYFARRNMGEQVGEMAYLKKAAGPYNPSMKYSGGIAIAKRKNWLREARGRYGFGHVPGPDAGEMDDWIGKYAYGEPARWVAEHFRFKKNEEWETLATVDYAIEHLQSHGIEPDAAQVLQYIHADDEWRPKIEKLGLTEVSIGTAILEAQALFGGGE